MTFVLSLHEPLNKWHTWTLCGIFVSAATSSKWYKSSFWVGMVSLCLYRWVYCLCWSGQCWCRRAVHSGFVREAESHQCLMTLLRILLCCDCVVELSWWMTEDCHDRVLLPIAHVSLQSRHPCQGLLEGTVNWIWWGFMLMESHLLSTLNVYKALLLQSLSLHRKMETLGFYRGKLVFNYCYSAWM